MNLLPSVLACHLPRPSATASCANRTDSAQRLSRRQQAASASAIDWLAKVAVHFDMLWIVMICFSWQLLMIWYSMTGWKHLEVYEQVKLLQCIAITIWSEAFSVGNDQVRNCFVNPHILAVQGGSKHHHTATLVVASGTIRLRQFHQETVYFLVGLHVPPNCWQQTAKSFSKSLV